MTARKPIPRAVLEERIRMYEERSAKRRLFAVQFGVYFMMVLGVIASQAIVMADDLSASFTAIELSQVGGSIFVASVLYSKMEGDRGDLAGKAKKENVGRVLRHAFYHGLTWMTLLGAWW